MTLTRWETFGEETNKNEERLPKIWLEAPKSSIHRHLDWEIQVVETLGVEEDWPWWWNWSKNVCFFHLTKGSWEYLSTSKILSSVLVFNGKPNSWKEYVRAEVPLC